jgi:hypothetical protein
MLYKGVCLIVLPIAVKTVFTKDLENFSTIFGTAPFELTNLDFDDETINFGH